ATRCGGRRLGPVYRPAVAPDRPPHAGRPLLRAAVGPPHVHLHGVARAALVPRRAVRVADPRTVAGVGDTVRRPGRIPGRHAREHRAHGRPDLGPLPAARVAPPLATAGMLLYFGLGYATKWTIFDFWLTDPLAVLLVVGAILLA